MTNLTDRDYKKLFNKIIPSVEKSTFLYGDVQSFKTYKGEITSANIKCPLCYKVFDDQRFDISTFARERYLRIACPGCKQRFYLREIDLLNVYQKIDYVFYKSWQKARLWFFESKLVPLIRAFPFFQLLRKVKRKFVHSICFL